MTNSEEDCFETIAEKFKYLRIKFFCKSGIISLLQRKPDRFENWFQEGEKVTTKKDALRVLLDEFSCNGEIEFTDEELSFLEKILMEREAGATCLLRAWKAMEAMENDFDFLLRQTSKELKSYYSG